LKIAGTAQLPYAPARAWDLMQDPVVLAKTIPGCQSLEKSGDNEYRLKMKMMLASLSGAFEGKVTLADPVPPESFRMIVEGSGKIGFMKGDGVLRLSPQDSGTEVAYDGEAQIGGTMAAVGQRLIDVTARMLIRRFFEKLSEEPDA
jgi:carbon monoxide dehydrogenase subunit G